MERPDRKFDSRRAGVRGLGGEGLKIPSTTNATGSGGPEGSPPGFVPSAIGTVSRLVTRIVSHSGDAGMLPKYPVPLKHPCPVRVACCLFHHRSLRREAREWVRIK